MGTTISGDTGVVFPDATTQSTAVTVATPFSINASAGAGAQLRLPEATANGVNYVAVKAADLLAANVTFTLPTADGTSGQVLQTNGSGVLSFGSVSPGGTTGQVQINNSGAFGAISSGTSGQVLTSNGAGVAPSFATPSGGLSEIDRWHLNTQTGTSTSSSVLTAWSRSSTYFTQVGTGMTQASGIFAFPSTGTWEICLVQQGQSNFNGTGISIDYTTNNSTYGNAAYFDYWVNASGSDPGSSVLTTIVTVTSTTNNKVRVTAYGISYAGEAVTFLTFKKLA